MKRDMWTAAASLIVVSMMGEHLLAIDTVTWTGGASGEWQDANAWKNAQTNATGDALTLLGQQNGSNGMSSVDPTQTRARNIVIGGGSRVEFYRPTAPGGDFRIQQGSNLTIKEGATWIQETDATYSENGWTQMDPSNLIIDGGTFARTGESPAGDGGGLVLFGSYRDDANKDRLGLPSRVNVEIKNGGKIENTGQLWFGADDEQSVGSEVRFTINNGTMDLTGGTIIQSNSTLEVDADLAFFFDYDEAGGAPKNEKWEINFTGPGSITVDTAGINVYRQDETSTWTGGPISYQDLWNQGILKANGLSGAAVQPADFNTFFSVTGTPGTNNYALTSKTAPIETVTWVGGASGEWQDANAWKNAQTNATGDALTLLGQQNGSNGMSSVDPTQTRARNIVIGGGSRVEFYRPTAPGGDFRIQQGSNLTIKEGATWIQETDATYSENGWTQMDPSNLIIDGGTFARTGESPAGDGGGLVLFGSYRDDANKDRLGLPSRVNVEIKNGGKIENTGQLWFGADDEQSVGSEVRFTINNGTMDLTGGTIIQSNSTLEVDADLAFFFDYDEAGGAPKNEKWEINFTGPGSITVDTAGINVYRQDETSTWTGGAPVSYQDLWNQGILKANGLSGAAVQPADFNTFFSVTGTPGTNNYKLTSLLAGAPGLSGDYDANGIVDGTDFLRWQRTLGQTVTAGSGADGSGNGVVDAADLAIWKTGFGAASSAVAGAVPEPSAILLAFVAFGSVGAFRSRRIAE